MNYILFTTFFFIALLAFSRPNTNFTIKALSLLSGQTLKPFFKKFVEIFRPLLMILYHV